MTTQSTSSVTLRRFSGSTIAEGADVRSICEQHRANLQDANLQDADLRGAHLTGAHLTGAKGIIDGGPCSRGYRWIAVLGHKGGPRIAAGCRWYTLPEAQQHWGASHEDNPALRAECLAKLAELERQIAETQS